MNNFPPRTLTKKRLSIFSSTALLLWHTADLISDVEREVRRLEGTGQLGFGFPCIASSEEQERGVVEEELFLDADPHELLARSDWKPI